MVQVIRIFTLVVGGRSSTRKVHPEPRQTHTPSVTPPCKRDDKHHMDKSVFVSRNQR